MKNTMLLAVPAPGIQPQMESGIRLLPIWTLLPLVFFWFELKLLFTATFAAVVPERLKYDSNHFMIALDSGSHALQRRPKRADDGSSADTP
jgi:hypothetical protein